MGRHRALSGIGLMQPLSGLREILELLTQGSGGPSRTGQRQTVATLGWYDVIPVGIRLAFVSCWPIATGPPNPRSPFTCLESTPQGTMKARNEPGLRFGRISRMPATTRSLFPTAGQAIDDSGNSTNVSANVVVPHDAKSYKSWLATMR